MIKIININIFIKIVCANILLILNIYAQNPAELDKQLHQTFSQSDFASAAYTLVITDISSGKIIYAKNPEALLIPASAQKIITANAALDKLGKDKKLPTILRLEGELSPDGVLKGNIRIIGSGDPTLGSSKIASSADWVLNRWTGKIKAAGIKKITGDIIGDATCFTTEEEGKDWLYEDMGNYYSGTASGLCLEENQYTLTLSVPGEVNTICNVKSCFPDVPGLRHISYVRTSNQAKDDVWILGAPGQWNRKVTGTIPLGKDTYSLRGSLPDAPMAVAFRLKERLEKNGIQVEGTAVYALEAEKIEIKTKSLDTIYSPPLSKILEVMLRHSQNMYAENMLYLLLEGNPKSYTREVLLKPLNLPSKPSVYLMDASGLSPFNALNAYTLCIAASQWYQKMGKSGLKEQVPGVWVKSGYMERVRAYTGIIERDQQAPLAFAFIVNQYQSSPTEMRKQMEKVMSLMNK